MILALLTAAAAYAQAVASPIAQIGGRNQYLVSYSESGSRDTTEITITGVPTCGTIVAYRAALTAGTGTTIHPRIGTSAAFVADSINEILEATATSSIINEVGSTPYCTATGTLYMRSAPNSSATDHAITTRIVIVAGAQQ
jgi:hypothetical protein